MVVTVLLPEEDVVLLLVVVVLVALAPVVRHGVREDLTVLVEGRPELRWVMPAAGA